MKRLSNEKYYCMVLKSNILLFDYGHDLQHTNTRKQIMFMELHDKEIGVKFAYLSKTMV